MKSIVNLDLFSIENKLSIYEMQEIQAGKLDVSSFCKGWGTVTVAVAAYGWWTMTNPVGWVGAGVLIAGDAACLIAS